MCKFPKFQYLMVQLKAAMFVVYLLSILLFQYLMVQLKESPAPVSGGLYIISIPHGTIKRAEYTNELQKNMISIPHGTIKRKKREEYTYMDLSFQYLMVQLKAQKRYYKHLTSIFQYLMVQLKVMLIISVILNGNISIPHGTIKRQGFRPAGLI